MTFKQLEFFIIKKQQNTYCLFALSEMLVFLFLTLFVLILANFFILITPFPDYVIFFIVNLISISLISFYFYKNRFPFVTIKNAHKNKIITTKFIIKFIPFCFKLKYLSILKKSYPYSHLNNRFLLPFVIKFKPKEVFELLIDKNNLAENTDLYVDYLGSRIHFFNRKELEYIDLHRITKMSDFCFNYYKNDIIMSQITNIKNNLISKKLKAF